VLPAQREGFADRQRIPVGQQAVRLPGVHRYAFPRGAPETVLANWYLRRGELDPAQDLLNETKASCRYR